MPDLINIVVNLLPMLLLIGVWIFFMRRMGAIGGKHQTVFQKDYIEEMRKQSAIFERIAAALEKPAS